MQIEVRAINDDEVEAFVHAEHVGFGEDAHAQEPERFRSILPLDRTSAAFDGAEIVGTLGEFPLTLTVPGGSTVSMSGTTMVTVQPTHRRRGVLRQMMAQHLERSARRGDPLAGLWASEAAIYGRFGFGLAIEQHEVRLDTRMASVAPCPPDITVSSVSGDQVLTDVAPFWTAVGASRPGWIERGEIRWKMIVADHEHRRNGSSALRQVVARRHGEVVGYLSYRQNGKWDHGVPQGTVRVDAIAGADEEAQQALWNFVASIDLFPIVEHWNVPIDDALAYTSGNMREVVRTAADGLYLRPLDVIACLEARRYELNGTSTIRVDDGAGYAAGTYRVAVRDGAAEVTRTEDDPEVALDVRELGSLYLGRACCDLLMRMGRITGEPAAIRRLGQLMRTERAPYCPEMF